MASLRLGSLVISILMAVGLHSQVIAEQPVHASAGFDPARVFDVAVVLDRIFDQTVQLTEKGEARSGVQARALVDLARISGNGLSDALLLKSLYGVGAVLCEADRAKVAQPLAAACGIIASRAEHALNELQHLSPESLTGEGARVHAQVVTALKELREVAGAMAVR